MAHPNFVVVDVVGRRNFKTAGTKLHIYITVLNNGNGSSQEGHQHALSGQMPETLVFRIHTNSGIAQNGFGTGGGYGHISTGLPLHLIIEVIEFRIHLLINHFLVGYGGQRLGVPVDHAHSTVNQTLVVEFHKGFDNALAADFVHGETGAVPVAGGTQLFQLLQNDAAVLIGPCPGVLQKVVARKRSLGNALLAQFIHHLGFGGNGSVRSEEHTSELQSRPHLVCRLLLEKKKTTIHTPCLWSPARGWRTASPSSCGTTATSPGATTSSCRSR